ncbi:MAG: ABC transporter ATP-binding protein [Eubacteriales bacterium]|nr:ABC transporter ATP-binding protein [Eubacteriales bacterium]MDD4324046.1 ABC transporter ATP-binding protein [Eubacteriales bacterium]MDD4541514.1 ABC transporter ATP-binding protein [Eubacteriales bacterium]
MNNNIVLKLDQVSKHYGGVAAVDDVSLQLHEGEILGLIGPNGAGKTTLFNCIAGYTKPSSGEIYLGEKPITGLKPHKICKLGIGRTFQIVQPFGDLSVLENVMIGAFCNTNSMARAKEISEEILELTKLSHKKNDHANSLTIVDRKQLEIARALATKPRILLLDEVMAGLNPTESAQVSEMVKGIRDEMNISLLLIEHVMSVIMYLSDCVCVLDHGELIAQGCAEDVTTDERVIKSYLGEKYASRNK